MVRNIWAVGRNYAEHAKELGNEVPTTPVIFLKAGSCATFAEETITLPDWSEDIHHEVELALHFGKNLTIDQGAIALDLTERKKQNELKAKSLPWTLAKSFKEACPLSNIFPVANVKDLSNVHISLSINGETKQDGSTAQMIFSIETLIAYVCKHFPVCEGDWLLTGTPSGVGPIKRGDKIQVKLEGKIEHSWIVK
jgi:2-keto-4-pentenoate hydratase/2-oxohepta-3-ene-1,7-dioic acid hydratase in catechol pathway